MEATGDFVHRTVWHMNDVGRGRSKRERKNINSLENEKTDVVINIIDASS